MDNKNVIIRIFVALAIYLGLEYLAGDVGDKILYPIRLLVTFLHEFGHGLGALITGGSVNSIQINSDGSGVAETIPGSRAVILMGGYIGSAILGNLLFYIGARARRWAQPTVFILAAIMVFTAVKWYESMFTTGFLIAFAVVLLIIANRTQWEGDMLMFLGLATIIYIIQDFNVGPRSDLEKYAEIFVFIPAAAWMYIWLGIVILLFIFNIRMIFRSKGNTDLVPPNV